MILRQLSPLFMVLSTFANAVSLDDEPTVDADFPITLPRRIEFGKGDQKEEGLASAPFVRGDEHQPCLFYAESISVVVFHLEKKVSYWAHLGANGKSKFGGSIICPTNQTAGTEFGINLRVSGADTPGFARTDADNKNKMFSVGDVDIDLHFKFTQPGYWKLVRANATKIDVKAANDPDIPSMTVDESWLIAEFAQQRTPSWNIDGFKDYGFACARTNPIVWSAPKEGKNPPNKAAVGVTLNNIQFQPFNSTFYNKETHRMEAKFGRRVNDCAPLFSIATWMGLLVILLLLGVLSFGFLMLNSVQTMDRFDDPKQRQLVISAKE